MNWRDKNPPYLVRLIEGCAVMQDMRAQEVERAELEQLGVKRALKQALTRCHFEDHGLRVVSTNPTPSLLRAVTAPDGPEAA